MTAIRTIIQLDLDAFFCFTEATLAGLRAVFIERLNHGLGSVVIRRRAGKAAAGATRVLKLEHERQPVLRQWAMTIADVYLPVQPEGAAERVRAWAAAIRRELAPVRSGW